MPVVAMELIDLIKESEMMIVFDDELNGCLLKFVANLAITYYLSFVDSFENWGSFVNN